MRILYVNFINNVWGHKRLDINLIKYLSTFANVTVISPEGWYDDLPSDVNVVFYQPPEPNFINGPRKTHYYSLKIMQFAMKIDRTEKFDYIIAATFNTAIFSLGRLLFKNLNRFYIVHHYNTDTLEKKKLNFLFSTYVNRVKHIVFEDFISDYLIKKYDLNDKDVLVVPHPLYKNNKTTSINKYICVGLSNSNDEDLINLLIDIEVKEGIIQKRRLPIVLRSKTRTFDNGYLKVIEGYIEKNEYDEYINNTSSVFLAFPKDFKYRMSGTLIDALSNGKIVIGTDIPLMRSYSKKYPKICYVIKNVNDIFEILKIINDINKEELEREFNKFENDHSKEKIISILENEFSK